jgi:lysophospholipase L1-like esterase
MARISGLLLALCSSLLTLGALEVAARYTTDPTDGHADILALTADARAHSVLMKSDDPELIYVTRPNYSRDGIRISNGQGVLRPDDVAVDKPAGTFRVAVVGDSIAAGHPLRSGPALPFPMQLEARLRERRPGRPTEVLDFAADGYSTLQEARLVETEIARFSPDVLVVAYCLNDPSDSYTPAVWFLDHPAPRSYLLDFVRRRLGYVPSELSPAHPRYTWGAIAWGELYRRDGPLWATVDDGLTRIAAYGRSHNVPTLFLMFPLLFKGDEPVETRQQIDGIYAQVRDAATSKGFRFVDLRDAYSGHSASELRFLPEDPIHPGALGHTLTAQALLSALDANQLLPDSARGVAERR